LKDKGKRRSGYKKRKEAIEEWVQKIRESKSMQEQERELEKLFLSFYPLNPSYVPREHCSFMYESLI